VKIYNIHQKIKIEKGLVIGIGKFDGVHLGHQKLIKKIISISKRKNKIPAVFTFKNFPLESYITPFEEKISLLKKYGIEICIWSNFEEIKNWDGEKFIEFLIKIGVKEIVVGFNFKFGKDRKWDVDLLKDISKKYGFSVNIVNAFEIDGEVVNTSKIKKFLREGNIERANKFLGRHFSIKGKVVAGSGRGKKIGFPTANILLDEKIEIGQGVYAGYVFYKGEKYKGGMNVGNCPTFGEKRKRVEVYIFDFEQEIYGETIEVFFLKKIRDEIKFSSIDELKKQIKKDINIIKEIK